VGTDRANVFFSLNSPCRLEPEKNPCHCTGKNLQSDAELGGAPTVRIHPLYHIALTQPCEISYRHTQPCEISYRPYATVWDIISPYATVWDIISPYATVWDIISPMRPY